MYKIVYIFVYLGASAPGVYDVPIVRGGGRVNLVNGKRAVPVQEIQEGFQEAWQYQAVFDVPGTIERLGKSPLQQCRKMGILAPETVQLLHGLDCYRLPTAPSCPPSHKELHCMVGSVPYGLVRWVGMSLILGGGPTPRPPKLCISVY